MATRSNLILGVILIAAFGVRFHAIDRFATGYDELFTVLEANGLHPEAITEGQPFTKGELSKLDTPGGVVRACIATDGGNGVAYIVAMHAWTECLGNSNLAIRLFSLFWGMVVVWLVHRLALLLFADPPLALLSSAFAALAPLLVDYSQEARAYMPATAFTLLATIRLVRLMRAPNSSLGSIVGYGLLIGTAMLLHYSTVYIAMGHALFALLHAPFKEWRRWFIGAVPIAAAMLGIWLLLGGYEGVGNMGRQNELYSSVIAADPGYDVFYRKATVTHLAQDALIQFLWLGGNSLFLFGPSLRVMAMLLAIPAGLLFGLRGGWPRHRKERTLLIILAMAGTVFTLLTSWLSGHTFGMRYYYVMFSAPYAVILMAMGTLGLVKHGTFWKRLVGWGLLTMSIGILVLSILSFYRFGYRGNDEPERVRPFAMVVTALAERMPHARLSLVHGEARDGLTVNLHLGMATQQMQQIIGPTDGHRSILVATTDGRERVLYTLR